MERDQGVCKYKIVVVGNAGAGKTSIIKQYVNNYFSQNYKVTIGVDFALKVLDQDGTKVHLQLWDIAGQERFGSMTRIYYKAAAGAIIVFDLTNEESFASVDRWKNDLVNQVAEYSDEQIPIILIGNKVDLVEEEDKQEQWLQRMNEYITNNSEDKFIGCKLTSAKDDLGIQGSIENLVEAIMAENREDISYGTQKLNRPHSSPCSPCD
eukprot:TRINITY_DN4685_c0_g1_i1.p1 TRINITY_DN4685_c0_g1~~TRINITY_DN4685_c0_g1_i1.p1  ORF type:complete len:209 (-),score=47.81 TRINITY_DN4685_c0_g1_i1:5-631(-)